ncbi:cellulase family glycosylhydrolase [Candidatus Omnitrophota bacterium]
MPKQRKIFTVFLISLTFFVTGVFADQKSDSFDVAIFKEENFSYTRGLDGLTPEWIAGSLEDTYNIMFLNADQLKNKRLFNTDKVDLLILSYGGIMSEDVSSAIVEFIRDGGGLFTTGGIPFSDKYLLSMGVSYYVIDREDIASVDTKADIILDTEFEMKEPFSDQYGLCVKISERIYNKLPTMGNVFPFRIPARDFINPVILLDKNDNYIGAPVTLVKSWKNPYKSTGRIPNKWCLIGFVGEQHPLNPKDKNSAKRLKHILEFLSTRVILKDIETEYASYRDGETISLTTEMLNYGTERKRVELHISIAEKGRVLFKEKKDISIDGGEAKTINTVWKPEILESDFYEVRAVLRLDGRVIDEEQNAFTAWHIDRLKKVPWLSIKGRRFYRDDEPIYLHGVNYYESKTGGLMWARPNMLDIERDLKLMSNFGINFLRVHYHHPGWFSGYFKRVELPISDYFDKVENIERSLRILDAFVVLCNKYGIYFHPDLFTLVPEEMGDPRGWIGDLKRCTDHEKIEAQKEFVKVLSARYKDMPNIIWDLWNEPFLDKGNTVFLKNWTEEIKDCFRANGDQHLITLGSDESIELVDTLDFVCGHGHDVEIPDLNKPFIMQEIWNESDLSPEREALQAEKLVRDFAACVEQGGAGFAPWQWTRQSCLWDDASDPERWDNELGLCVREDGSLKPAGRLYKDLIRNAE